MSQITKKPWRLTNGDFEIELCETCQQPIYSGHVDCTCDQNHPDNCKRPTYDALTNSHASLVAALGDLLLALGSEEIFYTATKHAMVEARIALEESDD
tara:strand:- start:38 stop:331 length:294 start_codon:yes stop_codon:yes gene_type:complete